MLPALLILLASWLPDQAICWPRTPCAESYRVYYSDTPERFCADDYREFAAADICQDMRSDHGIAWCCEANLEYPGQYWTVVTVSEQGRLSSEDPGSIDHGRIVECP